MLRTSCVALWIASLVPFADAQTTSYGSSCPGGSGQAPVIELSGYPYAQLPMHLIVQGPANTFGLLLLGTSKTVFNGVPLPLNLQSLGLPGCQLLNNMVAWIPITTDASGEARVPIAGETSWGTIYAQAFVADAGPGTLGAMTNGLEITFQPVPPGNQPIISSFGPTTAGEGDVVTFYGANFGTDPGDLLFLVDGPEPLYFKSLTCSQGCVQARLLPYGDSDVGPGKVVVRRGMGAITPLPNLGGAVFHEPAFAVCLPLNDPSSTATSELTFNPIVNVGAEEDCAAVVADSPGYQKQVGQWNLNAGDLVYTVPDQFCAGDQLYVYLWMQRCGYDDDYGFFEAMEVPASANPCNPFTSDQILTMLNLALTFGLGSAGIPVDTVADTAAQTITIRAKPGAGTICFAEAAVYVKYGPTTLHSYQAESDDNFVGPTATSLSPALAAHFAANAPGGVSAPFDANTLNQWFGHSFQGIPAGARAAALTLRVKALGSSLASNDSISLCFDSGAGSFRWGTSIANLPELGGSYSSSTGPITICLDLANLPTANGPVNLVECLCSGTLDVFIQDDTAIDWMKLEVRTCP